MGRVNEFWDSLSRRKISRKRFLKFSLLGLAAFFLGGELLRPQSSRAAGFNGRMKKSIKGDHDIVEASGDDPFVMTVRAIEEMGGMGRFVKAGDTVVVKPNIGWDRAPEYAATTNPMVVAALVELCLKAGAKRVNVFDNTCNAAQRCYVTTGIKAAAESKGAKVYFVDDWNIINARFDYNSPMDGWPIFRDAVDCDCFINVPVLKHHGLTRLTISMKNLMGVCSGGRGKMHFNIGPMLADLTDFIKPELTVIDAYRVLVRNGPTGGSLNDVVDMKKLLVATDPVLADTYACYLLEKQPLSIKPIPEAAAHNLGSTDINRADILKFAI